MAGPVKTALSEYYVSKGSWPSDATAAGISSTISTPDVVSSITFSTADTTATITVTIRDTVASGIDNANNQLLLVGTAGTSGITWSCTTPGTGAVPSQYLPANCR